MAWVKIDKANELDNEESLGFEIEGHKLALHKLEDQFYVSDNICTHQYALLSEGFLEDGCIECPLHQAQFCLKTGKAMSAPATVDIKVYEVKQEDGQVLVSFP